MRAMPPRIGRAQRAGSPVPVRREQLRPMLRGEVTPATKAKAEKAAAAAGISLAFLLELLIDHAPVDAEGRMIGLPDAQTLIAQRRARPGRPPAELQEQHEVQEELPLKTA